MRSSTKERPVSDQSPQTQTASTDAAKAMTAAQAAKAVTRSVVIEKDGKPVTRQQPLPAAEVLSFKDYGTHVVVVTVDGQKLSSAAEA